MGGHLRVDASSHAKDLWQQASIPQLSLIMAVLSNACREAPASQSLYMSLSPLRMQVS